MGQVAHFNLIKIMRQELLYYHSTLQMRKLRHKKFLSLAQDHTTRMWWDQDLYRYNPVGKRTSSLKISLVRVYLSQIYDNYQETKSQWTLETVWSMAVLQLVLYIRLKGGAVRRVP